MPTLRRWGLDKLRKHDVEETSREHLSQDNKCWSQYKRWRRIWSDRQQLQKENEHQEKGSDSQDLTLILSLKEKSAIQLSNRCGRKVSLSTTKSVSLFITVTVLGNLKAQKDLLSHLA